MNQRVKALINLIEKWGGSVELEIPDKHSDLYRECNFEDKINLEDEGFSPAPFVNYLLAIDWQRKHFLFCPECVKAADLIHEMAHVFASKKEPKDSKEWSFFGWEWALARKIQIPQQWIQSNRHYGIYNQRFRKHIGFGMLNTVQKYSVLNERVTTAKRSGLINKSNIPISIR